MNAWKDERNVKKKIAVITARADDRTQKDIICGIAEAAFAADTDVVMFSNIYNHRIRDEFLNFENVIYDFFDPSGFDGVIVTAEAFLDISTTKPRKEICEVFVLCILSLLSFKTYGGFPQAMQGKVKTTFSRFYIWGYHITN